MVGFRASKLALLSLFTTILENQILSLQNMPDRRHLPAKWPNWPSKRCLLALGDVLLQLGQSIRRLQGGLQLGAVLEGRLRTLRVVKEATCKMGS